MISLPRFVSQAFKVSLVAALAIGGPGIAHAKSKNSSKGRPQASARGLEGIVSLNNQSADFYDFLLRFQGQFVPKNDLNKQVRLLEEAVERYLASIGVSYQKEARTIEDVQFEGAAIERMSFATYVLTKAGSSTEANAVFIDTVLQSSYMSENRLILNPFLQVEDSRVQGYFEPQNQKIEFGVTALSYRILGLGDTLAHELRHAEEQQKLVEGQPTLAAWIFRSKTGQPSQPYSSFFRLDEILTHRMDVDFLQNQAPLLEVNIPDPSKLKGIRDFRTNLLEEKKATLSYLESKARKGLQKVLELHSNSILKWSCLADLRLTFCKADLGKHAGDETVEVQFKTQKKANVNELILSVLFDSLGEL